ncbi:MAG: aspartate--tRNA ligase [Clostridiales bacterium]|jgi:aspartyl-tRNA synthetase|nr:aspartate--tRNA ligase [Clostridiales bacterium]
MYRTHTCGSLSKNDTGKRVRLAGWIDTVRDHGGVVFIDLRDHYGITQVVFNDDGIIRAAGKESVISAEGVVRLRDKDTVNKKLATGEVELAADSFEILGVSERSLPFEISESRATNEAVRLKYRFLDLRNPAVHRDIELRSRVTSFIRRKMEELGFLEIQTPILTSSSPEGARDYLVPSRKHKGMFYALPQAPQIFKQLLMTSGFDKYFQIAPCFRDEDARADRSPGEFYQVDFEMAFATQDDVFDVAEELLYGVFSKFSKKKVGKPPFARIPYAEAVQKYGSDKPDLRNPLIINDLSDFFADVDFAPFKNKPVRGIVTPDCIKMPKSFFENMLLFASDIGMKGLGYISVAAGFEYKGPIVKFLTAEKLEILKNRLGLKENDVLFFVSDTKKEVDRLAGQIRCELGKRLNLTDASRHEFCFVTDFPMFGINEDTGETEFVHNPFSMPQGGMDALATKNPLEINAYQYDIVCDGIELSSGAVRNHRPDLMVKAFEIAGYSKETVEEKFSALYNAFRYGAPPHAGMAPGLDRIVMLLTENESIREIVAFPMNSNAQDLLLGAPGRVGEEQLRDVHIKIR